MPEGSGVSREQLNIFAVKADGAASEMEGAVGTLGNDLSQLSAVSRGAWIAKFNEVKMQIQDELIVMNRALHDTSEASRAAAGQFESGDVEQEQTQSSVGSQVPGLTAELKV